MYALICRATGASDCTSGRSARPRGRAASDRLRPPATRTRGPGERRRGLSCGQDLLEALVEALAVPVQVDAALKAVADELPVAGDEERLGEGSDAVVRERVARTVVSDGVAHPVLAREPAGGALEVVRVDPQHDEPARAVPLPDALEQRRLVLTGVAPGGPEVDHDRAAAIRVERELPRPVEAVELERRSGRRLSVPGLLGRAFILAGEPPDPQRKQARHERESQNLGRELQPACHLAEG